jgi:hypothetical protein
MMGANGVGCEARFGLGILHGMDWESIGDNLAQSLAISRLLPPEYRERESSADAR